jgi:hypothetical protein
LILLTVSSIGETYMLDPIEVEKFFRAAIAVSTITCVAMIAVIALGYWSLLPSYWSLLPAVIASLGVIVSFGVHLNTLVNRFATPQQVQEPSKEPVPYPH